MVGLYKIADLWYSPEKRIKSFGIKPGTTVVDYGCGPGRYLRSLSVQVGAKGKVLGADIHELALQYSRKRIRKYRLKNVELLLVREYRCEIGDREVDYICALDMLHLVQNVQRLFKELHRIIKPGGTLILDDGHQKRRITKAQITESDLWNIFAENKDYLKCHPK
jgi:ubiquinone/menaquinone biosynthesis C-methylase UbiE